VTIGMILFLAVIAFLVVMFIQQSRIHRMAAELEGSEVGELPEPYASVAKGDTLLWFHSPSCGPCRAMYPDVKALEADGKLHVVDVTQHFDVARAFKVMATPTTVRVKHGRIVAVRAGVLRGKALETLGA
jgi:thiol-disulfide isomerase/thioredoxin